MDKQRESEWFYELDGKQCGAVSLEDMCVLIQSKTLTSSTRVWTKSLSDWTSLEQTELAEYLNQVNDQCIDVPPPLPPDIPQKTALGFLDTLKDVWGLVYGPTSASVFVYLLCMYLGYDTLDAYNLWISPLFVALSWLIVLAIWGHDIWKFKNSDRYSGWSWWWLIMPYYLYVRVGRRLSYTFAMIILSIIFSGVVSTILTLHGTGYFEHDDFSYQDDLNGSYLTEDIAPIQPAIKQSPELNRVAYTLQSQVDIESLREYGRDYTSGDNKVYVEQVNSSLFKAYDSWSCGSSGCQYSFYGVVNRNTICELNARTVEQAIRQTECSSEPLTVR